ncbi:MAG: DUF1206 domain-containing protein [Pelagibaca sp.]
MADITKTIMRIGYSGRGITYLTVASISLWAIWQGGQAKGPGSALERLSDSTAGMAVLCLVAIGLFTYALWRVMDAFADLEEYGSDGEGVIARVGMVVTGLTHGALGALALFIVLGRKSGNGQGGVTSVTARVLDWPGGQWIVGFAALCTLGAGLYYLHKAINSSYRANLRANHFTRNWDWALRAGVAAQGVLVVIIGGFLFAAARRGSEQSAGGIGEAFDWIASLPFGNVLIVLICVALLGFAFFCFVNAAYRIIPRTMDGQVETLKDKIDAAR